MSSTTLASVYSRALDLQTELVHQMEHPAIRRAMAAATSDPALVQLIYATVAQSEAGYVSRPVCDLIGATARTIPDVTLRPEHLLAPHGFLLLAEPFRLTIERSPQGDPFGPVRSVSWYTFGGHEGPGAEMPEGGIFAVLWLQQMPDRPNALAPLNTLTWGFGEPWSAAVDRRRTDGQRQIAETCVRWIAALNAFCEQRLVTPSREPPERAARRRVERAGRSPSDILVVELRRVDHRSAEPGGTGREWSCSWTVSGHWRHQWYESKQEHRAIWISPYLKGDPSKPIRARKRVFAVVN